VVGIVAEIVGGDAAVGRHWVAVRGAEVEEEDGLRTLCRLE